MMAQMPATKSNSSPRLLVQKFASHLANLLNTGSPHVEIKLYELDETLTKTLSNEAYARLIGTAVIGADFTPSDVARKYFETVLERPLFLKGQNHTHKGHELFLALCRRGLDPLWPESSVVRGGDVSRPLSRSPADFPDVSVRLSQVPADISPGNPAASTREKCGALVLKVGNGNAEVAEELSIWNAIKCAPLRLSSLKKGPDQRDFFSLVIRAVENANKHYGTCISVGLSPFGLASEHAVNTLKELSTFLTRVRQEIGGSRNDTGDLDTWQRVWNTRKVPGFGSADELWNSELGRALRFPRVVSVVSIEDLDVEPASPDDDDVRVLDTQKLHTLLDVARDDGAVDVYDVWLLREIDCGATLEVLARRPESKLRFRGNVKDFLRYVEDLHAKLLTYASKRDRKMAK